MRISKRRSKLELASPWHPLAASIPGFVCGFCGLFVPEASEGRRDSWIAEHIWLGHIVFRFGEHRVL